MAQAMESLALGVVVERRAIDNRWRKHDWRPVSVLPGADADARWRLLRDDAEAGIATFHAATLPLELYEKETEGYRVNLSNTPPMVYVVLRPGEDYGDEDVEPFLVTACPFEAESYAESGDEIVEGVPMPPEVLSLVHAFVARHHTDEPFKKRKRKPYDPRKGRGGEASGPLVKDAVWSVRNRTDDS
jgi:hypothetical protein